ncbi:MAG: restriction endonuclease subunit S [Paludibacteraceae bacterium]|nr:restriction endonuclease subunit S [Paludibacteraceae bacterium]
MKNSGIPWLKDIPLNWDVERGKNVLVLQKRPVRDNDEVVTCFRDGEVVLRNLRRVEGFTMSDKEIGYQGINQGDIVIHGMDGFAGAMGVSKSTGKGSPVLVVCTPKYDAIPQYLIYYLRALAITDVFVALATGIRERSCDLRWNKISELEFILPPSSEQHLIATFLDKKCSEIDSLIDLQEQMIEELKAYKQSVITEAVTKGLNPNVPMKDSGILFVDKIPSHWKETKTLRLLEIPITDGPHETPEGLDIGIPFISADAVSDGYINFDNKWGYISQAYYEECCKKYIPQKYDIYMIKSGASTGRTAIVETDELFTIWSPLAVFRANANIILPYFLLYVLRSDCYQKQVESKWTYGTQQNIGMRVLEKLIVSYPPISEQQAIADYLDKKCGEIDELITIKQQKIESLKEYKKSVIYEYVTGKREV